MREGLSGYCITTCIKIHHFTGCHLKYPMILFDLTGNTDDLALYKRLVMKLLLNTI